MKVLQTLGLHRNVQEGIFAYRRDADGVLIDGSVGHSAIANGTIRFTHAHWTAILQEIENLPNETLRYRASTRPIRIRLAHPSTMCSTLAYRRLRSGRGTTRGERTSALSLSMKARSICMRVGWDRTLWRASASAVPHDANRARQVSHHDAAGQKK